MDKKGETEYRSGGEFLMSVNNKMHQMIETKKEIENVSQYCLRGDDFTEIPENLLKIILQIYLPDDETIARELWRIQEYAEDLDTIKEEAEEELFKENTDDVKPEFTSGTEYLAWLQQQLPFLEPFLPDDEDHELFFHQWSRNDFKYTPRLQTLIEEELEEKSTAENNKEDIKPEFATGADYLRWLEQQLPFFEPFLPDDEDHEHFFHQWSRDDFKFTTCLEALNEETEEEAYKENTEKDVKPEFTSGMEYLDWLEQKLPFLEPFLPEYEVHEYFFREWSRHDFSYFSSLETVFEDEPDENLTEEDDEDIEPEFISGEEYLGWLGRQLPCLEPFVGDGTIHACYEFEWCKRNGYAPKLDTLIEENENEEHNEYKVSSEVNDARELKDEELNPYIKLMLQPSIFCMEILVTQSPASLVNICTQMIPTELTTDASHPEYETNPFDTKQQIEQNLVCKKARRRNFSFKFLNRNKKEKEDKKRSPGFFARFFH
ncbi:uncharacterized protein LOC134254574 [Saccostrea cucullata]|uniref:uncharacterized protein LOC134254574 n=1 Tax=Saccostrea cuccullata TaxID=36930 RepID=UPI002ED08958